LISGNKLKPGTPPADLDDGEDEARHSGASFRARSGEIRRRRRVSG